jgi:phage baseplate assembly protein W
MTATYYGFNPPFVGGTQKVLPRQEDMRLVKNDVLQLLFTLRGERVHRPTFGTRLRSTVFEPLTQPVLDDLRSDIISAINENEPRLINIDVAMTTISEKQLLKIVVIGRMSYDPTAEFLLETSIPAPGAAT